MQSPLLAIIKNIFKICINKYISHFALPPGGKMKNSPLFHLISCSIIFVFLLLCPMNGYAEDWYVTTTGSSSNDGLSWETAFAQIMPTVQNASVKDGDTIHVASGSYSEPDIDFFGKAIKIISESGPEVTIINNAEGSSVAWFHRGEYSTSILSGFSLKGATDNGAIHITNSSPTIENCIIDGNNGDSGIFVDGPDEGFDYATPRIRKCIIINNSGHGVQVNSGGNPTLYNCVIADNGSNGIRAYGDAGFLGLGGQPCNFNAINCTIANNGNSNQIYVRANAETHASLSNCIIAGGGNDRIYNYDAHFGIGALFPSPIVRFCAIDGSYDSGDGSASNMNVSMAQLHFINAARNGSDNYHLGVNSVVIGKGGGGLTDDRDYNQRPYFLNGSWDIGAYEFDFAYLIESNIRGGVTSDTWAAGSVEWKNITAGTTETVVDSGVEPGTTPQTFETHYYKINLAENYGVLRIWTEDSTSTKADTIGYLINGDDWKKDGYFKVDDNSGTNGNFSIVYPFTDGTKETYYLAVKGKNTNPYNLHIRLQTDPEDNICSNVVSDALTVIDKSFFTTGYEDKPIGASLDYSEDIDNHKLEFGLPGTIKIASIADNIDAVIKDTDCNVVAEYSPTEEGLEIIYDNIDNDFLYLSVKHKDETEATTTPYIFTIRYFPADDWYDVVTGVMPDSDWTATDVSTKGSLTYNSATGEYTVAGNGKGLDDGDNNPATLDLDEFYFAYKNVAGDFNFKVRVKDLLTTEISDFKEVGGITARDSLSQNSRNVFTGVTPSICVTGAECNAEKWVTGAFYTYNEVIQYLSVDYQCISSPMKSPKTPPDTNTDDWRAIPGWVSGTSYGFNDIIQYNGSKYQCISSPMSSTTATPDDTDFDNWKQINTAYQKYTTRGRLRDGIDAWHAPAANYYDYNTGFLTWLNLQREGNTYTTSSGNDGTTWSNEISLAMEGVGNIISRKAKTGMAVSSYNTIPDFAYVNDGPCGDARCYYKARITHTATNNDKPIETHVNYTGYTTPYSYKCITEYHRSDDSNRPRRFKIDGSYKPYFDGKYYPAIGADTSLGYECMKTYETAETALNKMPRQIYVNLPGVDENSYMAIKDHGSANTADLKPRITTVARAGVGNRFYVCIQGNIGQEPSATSAYWVEKEHDNSGSGCDGGVEAYSIFPVWNASTYYGSSTQENWAVAAYNSAYPAWTENNIYGSTWKEDWREVPYNNNYQKLSSIQPAEVNLAVGKSTSQSTTYTSGGGSGLAVDDNTSGLWDNGSVTHTQGTPAAQEWWQVDLGAISSKISHVNLFNRTDSCCMDRLQDFYLYISESSMAGQTVAELNANAAVWGAHHSGQVGTSTTIDVADGVSGQFVMIKHRGTRILSLAEVQVIEVPDTSLSSDLTDVLGKAWSYWRPVNDDSFDPWVTDTDYGTGWQQYWKSVNGDSIVGEKAIKDIPTTDVWTEGKEYETSQSTKGLFDLVSLDTRDIILRNTDIVNTSTTPPENLSRNTKVTVTASQSSTFEGELPIQAIDGNMGTINSTTSELNAWLQVDLEADNLIGDIKIYNRLNTATKDDTSAKLDDVFIFISENDMASSDIATLREDENVWEYYHKDSGALIDINVVGGFKGRYVKIVLNGTDSLHVREVEIYNLVKSYACIGDNTAVEAANKPGEGTNWKDFWKVLPDYSPEFPQWVSGGVYAKDGNAKYTGCEEGHITIRPETIQTDYDIFEFEVEKTSSLMVQTTGCTVIGCAEPDCTELDKRARLDIYNALGEKITTKESFDGHNYKISEMYADSPGTSAPFQVFPGKYYLKVSPYDNHTNAFRYGVYMECTTTDDDHGDYRANSTVLQKWYKDGVPLTYHNPEKGKIPPTKDVDDKDKDKDMFRFDVPAYSEYPNGATVQIMSDYADSSTALTVPAVLYDYSGNILGSSLDIRVANPYQPAKTIPVYSTEQAYSVNDVVKITNTSNFYKCIKTVDNLRQTRIILEDSEGGTGKWDIYDNTPVTPLVPTIETVDDAGRNAIHLISNGHDNGFRLTRGENIKWNIKDKTILEWSMKTTVVDANFTIYIDIETTDTSVAGGHRFLQYTPVDADDGGSGEYVHHGLGISANDGTWHTFTRNLTADLNDISAQPGNNIIEINGFWIRGDNYVDDISFTAGETVSLYWEKILIEDWVRGDAYIVGDIVKHNDSFFTCESVNSATTDPGDNTSGWSPHVAKSWDPYKLYEAFAGAYSELNAATENGNLYKCVQTMLMQINDPIYWDAIAEPPAENNFDNIITKKLKAGKYYVQISGAKDTDDPTEYSVVVDLDDYGNDIESAKEFKGYNTIKGHFETARGGVSELSYDTDVFELVVPEDNMVFSIYTTGSSETYGNLYSPTHGTHFGDSQPREDGNFTFTTKASVPAAYTNGLPAGTYYIQTHMKDTTKSGNYVLHIEIDDDYINRETACPSSGTDGNMTWDCDSAVMGELIAEPYGPVHATNPATGVLAIPADVDFFKFEPLADGRVTILSSGDLDETTEDLDLMGSIYKYNPSTKRAIRLDWDSDGAGDPEGNFKLTAEVTKDVTYLVSVKSQFPQDTGEYKVHTFLNTITTSYDRDSDGSGGFSGGDNYNDAREITLPQPAPGPYYQSYDDGGIDYEGDIDYYKFTLPGEGALTVYTKDESPPAFDSSTKYVKGMVVTHNDTYYECTAILSTLAEDPADPEWIEVAKPQLDTFGYLYQHINGMYISMAINDDSEFDKDDGFNFGIKHYVQPENLALNKPATQSSTFDSPAFFLDAGSANDGNKTSTNHTDCTDAEAWWQVDLQSINNISEIKLFHSDYLRQRFTNYYVFISDYDMSGAANAQELRDDTSVWEYYNSDIPTEPYEALEKTITISKGSPSQPSYSGRYMMVRLIGSPSPACLHLQEVEIYGAPEFYVKVKEFSGKETGNYSFHVEFDSEEKDDHGDDCSSASSIGPYSDHSGNIGLPSDVDFFKFVLGPVSDEGGELSANSHSSTFDPFGYLKNSMCSNIMMDDNGTGADEEFNLSWTQPCDKDADCDLSPETCCKPEIFHVAVKSFDNASTGTYKLNVESNGTFVDWGGSKTWAPSDGLPHYFGFEIPIGKSTVAFTADEDAGDLTIKLFSGDGGTEVSGYDSFKIDGENYFRLNRAGLNPGTYFAKVTPDPVGTTSTTAYQINVGDWRWSQRIIGAGSGNLNSGTADSSEFSITAQGEDIWGTSDAGYFVFRYIPGDFEMSARIFWVNAPDAWAKAGIMARSTIDGNSANSFSAYSLGNGYTAQFRDTSGAATVNTHVNKSAYSYVKMKRKGDLITSYRSNDGVNWEFSREDTLSGDILVGMAASSHNTGTACSVKFQNVTFSTTASGF